MESASDVSCDMDDNGLGVVGRKVAEELFGTGILPGGGAVRGNVLDKESGKTSVIKARCSSL